MVEQADKLGQEEDKLEQEDKVQQVGNLAVNMVAEHSL